MMQRTWTSGVAAMLLMLGLCHPAQAHLQTDFDFIGVSTNLMRLGVVEKWVEDGSGKQHCQVRIYDRNQWQPAISQELPQTDERTFEAQCQAFQKSMAGKYGLQKIDWALAEMTPQPQSIKDADGALIPSASLKLDTAYPARQLVEFTLPNQEVWQLVLNSANRPSALDLLKANSQQQAGYKLILRPKLEPIPFDVVEGTYQGSQILYSPIKLMLSDHYGLMALVLRDYRYGFEGYDYHYRPYFFQWPDYAPLSVDDAKRMLKMASQYAMEPSELVKGPNSLDPTYRAYLRLRTEKLPLDEIESALEDASPAGKLYWMALLHDQNPDRYKAVAQDMLNEPQANVDVIEIQGSNWQPENFRTLVRQQADGYKITLE